MEVFRPIATLITDQASGQERKTTIIIIVSGHERAKAVGEMVMIGAIAGREIILATAADRGVIVVITAVTETDAAVPQALVAAVAGAASNINKYSNINTNYGVSRTNKLNLTSKRVDNGNIK